MAETDVQNEADSTGQGLPPLLINAAQMARLLSVSEASVWAYLSAGRVPAPVKLGGLTRWNVEELRAWVNAGCPPAARWDLVRQEHGFGMPEIAVKRTRKSP